MPFGTVNWFSDEKGYGFIGQHGGGKDVFVHHSNIVGQTGRRKLDAGDRVRFDVQETAKGIQAVNVAVE